MKIFSNNLVTVQKRLSAFVLLTTFVFTILFGRLIYVQLIKGSEYQARAIDQWTRDLPLKALRGDILDAEGKTLAASYTSFDVYVRPRAVKDRARVAGILSGVLELDYDETYEKLGRTVSEVTIKKQVPKSKADLLKVSDAEGIYFSENSTRRYPNGEFLSQVLGFTNIDNEGQSGVEAFYNKYLTGTDGLALTETDIKGIELPERPVTYIPSIKGMSLKLTVDAEIQKFTEIAVRDAQKTFRAKSASCIVIDVRTGGVAALAQVPSFDLNAPPRDDIPSLNDLSKNKMVVDVYEPGSTFKVFTTAAALELGLTHENDRFFCPGFRIVDGQRIRCWKTIGHGSQTLAEGVKNSCNCVFMDLALRVGVERYYDYLERFGFGQKTGVDFFGESRGIVMPEKSVKIVDLARIGFGQAIAVTPLQVMSALSIVVNGGTRVAPHFAESVTTFDGAQTISVEPPGGGRALDAGVSKLLSNMLIKVVSEGSGKKAQVPGYKIGGKTGTAQKYANGVIAHGRYVSSFVGFAPADDPKYALIFIVDEPEGWLYYGSIVAAPYAGSIFASIFSAKNIPPSIPDELTGKKETVLMPSLTGLPLAKAVGQLAAAGLQYEVSGEDGVVAEQLPASGVEVRKGDVVVIRLE